MTFVQAATNIGLLGYALASIAYLVTFQSKGHAVLARRVAFGLLVLATAAVSAALAAVVQYASLQEMSSLLLASAIGWLAIGGHLQFNMRQIGAFVSPLATFILLIKFFGPVNETSPAVEPASLSVGVILHVSMAVIGQAFAIIACAISVLYLWQQNLLKKKLLMQLPDVPAIDKLDRHLARALWTGFVFITLGLVSGALYASGSPGIPLNAKVLWAVGVWGWYLAILLARNVFNRPSKRIAQMSLAGFIFLVLTYFGMGFFPTVGGV